jgi:transketolase
MKIILADRQCDDEALRGYIQKTLIDLAKEDPMVVTVDADLRMRNDFVTAFPEKTYDCGVQEANMIGVAAGMSSVGLKPYVHTFAPFATRRTFDTIFISAAYSKLNIKIFGTEAGICAEQNGGTHQSFEDMGLMRMVPDAMVFDVCDGVQVAEVVRKINDIHGVQYIRFCREPAIKIYDPNTDLELGKGVVLRDGKDVTIIAVGIMVSKALDAADILAEEGIDAAVIDMFTLKPIDKELIVEYAKKTGAIVTAENHNIINGLGSAVADVLVETEPVPAERVGVQDRFGEVGSIPYLEECMGLLPTNIVEKAKKAIARKRKD